MFMCCRRQRDEADSVVEGLLAAEVSLVVLDMLEIVIQVHFQLLLLTHSCAFL